MIVCPHLKILRGRRFKNQTADTDLFYCEKLETYIDVPEDCIDCEYFKSRNRKETKNNGSQSQ